MKSITDHIRYKCYAKHGFTEIDHTESDLNKVRLDIAEKVKILDKVYSLSKNRLIMGTLRYGVSNHALYDYRERLNDKLKLYDDTGNKEFLIDSVNYCVLEFGWPNRTDTFFKAEDDSISSKRDYDL